ncbi:toll/interleukin-1 receptor domain-containing protein [Aggregatilinea lenta]|uniref:toll/interleukin-1 receptor domain-containing protein n=1 Tax=Aggregatilinea lenta TaxID=913108 RepID=UPI000E5B1D87|nr:toll/interleukin-1 receptor domain-containing protein [Aggregatilinea lenta]
MRIFISFIESDHVLAETLAEQLFQRSNIDNLEITGLDRKGIPGGSNWAVETENNIRQADIVLALLSLASVSSSLFQVEIDQAVAYGKPLFPVKIGDIKLLPHPLDRINYFELNVNEVRSFDELANGIKLVFSRKNSVDPLVQDFFTKIRVIEKKPLPDRIFIAYAHEQAVLARELAALLRSRNKSVFYDAHIRAGSSWRRTVQKALDDATHVVVIWTQDAAESDEIDLEITYARGEGKRIIPLLSPDIPKLPYHLYNLHYLILPIKLQDVEAELLAALAHNSLDEGIWQ